MYPENFRAEKGYRSFGAIIYVTERYQLGNALRPHALALPEKPYYTASFGNVEETYIIAATKGKATIMSLRTHAIYTVQTDGIIGAVSHIDNEISPALTLATTDGKAYIFDGYSFQLKYTVDTGKANCSAFADVYAIFADNIGTVAINTATGKEIDTALALDGSVVTDTNTRRISQDYYVKLTGNTENADISGERVLILYKRTRDGLSEIARLPLDDKYNAVTLDNFYADKEVIILPSRYNDGVSVIDKITVFGYTEQAGFAESASGAKIFYDADFTDLRCARLYGNKYIYMH
jgi:hypothetical protein